MSATRLSAELTSECEMGDEDNRDESVATKDNVLERCLRGVSRNAHLANGSNEGRRLSIGTPRVHRPKESLLSYFPSHGLAV